MCCLSRWIVASLVILLPRATYGQCFDCRMEGFDECRVQAGYFCSFDNDIGRTSDHLNTSGIYSDCVPNEFFVKELNSWCCFWSREKGCNAAVHPRYYDEVSRRTFCVLCQTFCRCTAAWHGPASARIMPLISLLFIVWNRV